MTRHSRSIFDERSVRAGDARLRVAQARIASIRASTRGGGSRPAGGGRSREIVVRVLNKGKTPQTPLNQARYIARVNNVEHGLQPDRPAPTALETSDGRALTTRTEIDAEIRSWGLAGGDENRSTAWKAASPDERRRMDQQWREASPEWRKANPKADPYRSVQTVHIIVSVPQGTRDQMAETARVAAAEVFAGHKYVFAIHTDHGRGPHAHIIVAARNHDTGYQLPLKKTDLEVMRHRFAEAARDAGLDVTASRRVDRFAQEISQGEQQLRKHDRSRGRWTPGDTIAKKAPQWAASHYGTEYTARSAGLADVDQAKPFAQRFLGMRPAEAKSEAFQKVAAAFGHYANPHEATKSYLAMYREDPRLAQWAYTRHPVAFGRIVADQPQKAPEGKTAAKAAREVADRLYPQAAGDRRQELAAAVPAARATRQRDRGTAAVVRSYESLARDAAKAGDVLAAEDARARARAARSGQPMPAFRDAAQPKPQRQQESTMELSKNRKVRRFQELDRRVDELTRSNKQAPSAETANQLVQAQMLRRKAATEVMTDTAAVRAATDAGLQARIQHFQQARGLQRGGLTL